MDADSDFEDVPVATAAAAAAPVATAAQNAALYGEVGQFNPKVAKAARKAARRLKRAAAVGGRGASDDEMEE